MIKITPNKTYQILFSPFLKLFNISFLDPDMKKKIVTNLVKMNMIEINFVNKKIATCSVQSPYITYTLVLLFLTENGGALQQNN